MTIYKRVRTAKAFAIGNKKGPPLVRGKPFFEGGKLLKLYAALRDRLLNRRSRLTIFLSNFSTSL